MVWYWDILPDEAIDVRRALNILTPLTEHLRKNSGQLMILGCDESWKNGLAFIWRSATNLAIDATHEKNTGSTRSSESRSVRPGFEKWLRCAIIH